MGNAQGMNSGQGNGANVPNNPPRVMLRDRETGEEIPVGAGLDGLSVAIAEMIVRHIQADAEEAAIRATAYPSLIRELEEAETTASQRRAPGERAPDIIVTPSPSIPPHIPTAPSELVQPSNNSASCTSGDIELELTTTGPFGDLSLHHCDKAE